MDNSINNQNNSHFTKFEVFGDLSKADLTWQKYGQITAPLVVKDYRGVYTSRSKYKLYLNSDSDFDKLDTYGYKKILPSGLAVYPHEELDYNIRQAIEGQLKTVANFHIQDRIDAHNGDTRYWTVLSDEIFEVEKGDEIKLGVVIRNGIGTDVALGVDLYTYRLTCSNGAVARDKAIGTFSIPHVGDYKRIAERFADQIEIAFLHVKDLLKYYRKATQIRVNNEIANQLYQRLFDLGETYLPKAWAIPEPKDVVDLKKKGKFFGNEKLVKVTKQENLWEVFNDVTAAQRDRLATRKITFPSVAFQQNKLHQAVIQVVNKVSA